MCSAISNLFSAKETDQCCVCFSETAVIHCSNAHGMCGECFQGYAHDLLERGPSDLTQQHEGRIPCVCHPVAVGGCTASLDNQSVARFLSAEDYTVFDAQRSGDIRRRVFMEMNERLVETVREMANRLQQSSRGINKTLLAQQLRASIPGARMCGQCRYGPIEHYACSALTTHRRDAYNGNACPRCGWFAADISQWPAWDGNVPDDAIDSTSFDPRPAGGGSCSLEPRDDEAMAQRLLREEQRRLLQINEDHELARRVQAGLN